MSVANLSFCYFPQYSQLSVRLAAPHQLNAKPEADDLVFGKHFTDHMLKIAYHRRLGGWQTPEIVPLENLVLHPAAKVFHYAVEVSSDVNIGFVQSLSHFLHSHSVCFNKTDVRSSPLELTDMRPTSRRRALSLGGRFSQIELFSSRLQRARHQRRQTNNA